RKGPSRWREARPSMRRTEHQSAATGINLLPGGNVSPAPDHPSNSYEACFMHTVANACSVQNKPPDGAFHPRSFNSFFLGTNVGRLHHRDRDRSREMRVLLRRTLAGSNWAT